MVSRGEIGSLTQISKLTGGSILTKLLVPYDLCVDLPISHVLILGL